jgi:hypothetical protein
VHASIIANLSCRGYLQSLRVLRAGAVTFDPPLERGQASAVERLAMGTEEKVVFRFLETILVVAAHDLDVLLRHRLPSMSRGERTRPRPQG